MSAPLPKALRKGFKKLVEEELSRRAAALRLKISAATGRAGAFRSGGYHTATLNSVCQLFSDKFAILVDHGKMQRRFGVGIGVWFREGCFHLPEHLPISGKVVCQDERVLGSGRGEPVAEAVELIGAKREHRGAALQKGGDFRAVRLLDGDGLAVGAVPENPVSHFGQAFAAVDERRLAEDLAVRIEGGDLLGFG